MAVRGYTDAKGRKRLMVEFAQSHVRVCRRLPFGATRGEAAALETKLRREIFGRVQLGTQTEPLLKEAIAAWLQDVVPHLKDSRKPAQNAALLGPFVGDKPLRAVPEVARECTTTWSKPAVSKRSAAQNSAASSLSPATINRRLCVLKAAAKYAYKQGWIAENLSGRVTLLPGESKREVYLTAAQVRTLAGYAPTFTCKAAIMIAAYSGLRASELLMLTTPTSSRADTLTVSQSKTGKPRNVPIVGLLRPYLSALPLGLSYRQLIGQFWVAREKAGLPHVRWHDLRHTTASLLINAGVDLYTVGKILGHSSPATTSRYAHLSDATLKAAMAKLR